MSTGGQLRRGLASADRLAHTIEFKLRGREDKSSTSAVGDDGPIVFSRIRRTASASSWIVCSRFSYPAGDAEMQQESSATLLIGAADRELDRSRSRKARRPTYHLGPASFPRVDDGNHDEGTSLADELLGQRKVARRILPDELELAGVLGGLELTLAVGIGADR
jgi:hypothetical protein